VRKRAAGRGRVASDMTGGKVRGASILLLGDPPHRGNLASSPSLVSPSLGDAVHSFYC
jgi:hypothetical protein